MFIKQEFRQSSSSPSFGYRGILNHLFKAVSAISVSHPRTMVLADFCGFHRFGGISPRVEVLVAPIASLLPLFSFTH
jgi:hypothetical protein